MVAEPVTDDNNSFKLHLSIFSVEIRNMMILTREEKERLVLDLYNQGKTYREIAKEARISPRDIGIILRKAEQNKQKQQPSVDNSNGKATEVVDRNMIAHILACLCCKDALVFVQHIIRDIHDPAYLW
jgi:cytidylate kinase